MLIVHQLARILLDMDALDADALGRFRAFLVGRDVEMPLADERVIELADLIALRQVGVEIILAVESRPFVDRGVDRHAGAHRLADALGVGDGQHAGHRRINEADLGVWLRPERGRRAGRNSLALEVTWAWTSRPITTSHSLVEPWMR